MHLIGIIKLIIQVTFKIQTRELALPTCDRRRQRRCACVPDLICLPYAPNTTRLESLSSIHQPQIAIDSLFFSNIEITFSN